MEKRILDTEFIHLEIKNDVIFAQYKSNLKIDINDAKQIVKDRLAFFDGKKYKTLIVDQGVMSMTKEARDYLATDEGCKDIVATALILRSEFSKFLGNFYVKLRKPPMPVQIFTKESDALEWLSTIQEPKLAHVK